MSKLIVMPNDFGYGGDYYKGRTCEEVTNEPRTNGYQARANISDVDAAEIKSLRDSGLTITEISIRKGLSYESVRYTLNKQKGGFKP